jgi:hypothetical protein
MSISHLVQIKFHIAFQALEKWFQTVKSKWLMKLTVSQLNSEYSNLFYSFDVDVGDTISVVINRVANKPEFLKH